MIRPIFLLCMFFGASLNAQYTEVINSNRPGESQGAFAVGNEVLQLETVPFYGIENHDLLNTESKLFGLDYALRYGFLMEQLEVSWIGSFQSTTLTRNGITDTEEKFADFRSNTIGAKYLFFDPYKNRGEEKPNLYSWKANNSFQWRDLIPAISIYAGANIVFGENPYAFADEPSISPRFVLATQNNWDGGWVFVTNIIVDKITTDFPTYSWILTLTHSLGGQWALMGEYQGFKSDIYSDNLFRAGGAYLLTKDFQLDSSVTFNIKDTPSVFRVNLGLSYRFDFHKKDEIIEDTGAGSNRNDRKKDDGKKRIDGVDGGGGF